MSLTTKPLLQQQQKEIQEVFEEFKDPDNNKLNVNEFLEIMQTTGIDQNCELFVKKLEILRGKQLQLEEFISLFNFNYNEYDNFNMIFSLIDSSNSGKISREELRKQNDIWGLQLTERDIDIMINYSGSTESEYVSKQTLWKLLQSQQPSQQPQNQQQQQQQSLVQQQQQQSLIQQSQSQVQQQQ